MAAPANFHAVNQATTRGWLTTRRNLFLRPHIHIPIWNVAFCWVRRQPPPLIKKQFVSSHSLFAPLLRIMDPIEWAAFLSFQLSLMPKQKRAGLFRFWTTPADNIGAVLFFVRGCVLKPLKRLFKGQLERKYIGIVCWPRAVWKSIAVGAAFALW